MKEMPSAAATFVYEDDEHEKFINCPARAEIQEAALPQLQQHLPFNVYCKNKYSKYVCFMCSQSLFSMSPSTSSQLPLVVLPCSHMDIMKQQLA
ncbi:hypothetical protein Dimus_013584, partial [Dionaea muscipula]